jgi:hypothetical protein
VSGEGSGRGGAGGVDVAGSDGKIGGGGIVTGGGASGVVGADVGVGVGDGAGNVGVGVGTGVGVGVALGVGVGVGIGVGSGVGVGFGVGAEGRPGAGGALVDGGAVPGSAFGLGASGGPSSRSSPPHATSTAAHASAIRIGWRLFEWRMSAPLIPAETARPLAGRSIAESVRATRGA